MQRMTKHSAPELRPYLESRLPQALDILKRMVEVNSFTANPDGVNKLARLTAQYFAPLGFSPDYTRSFNPEFGEHLVLHRQGTGKSAVAMVSHLDTVFPPEEEDRNDFKWLREGNRIYGPGTQDIKGGTVMIWMVLEALQALNPELFQSTTWQIFLNSSEERFSPDFGELCKKRFAPGIAAALVFEAEGRENGQSLAVVARKGRATWRLEVSGRAAHAGGKHPHGANALAQLARCITSIQEFTDYTQNLTFTVGTASGGTVLNRVPHEAFAEGEFRAFRPEVYAAAKSKLMALEGVGDVRSPADNFPCAIRAQILSESRPWPRNPQSDWLYAFWAEAARDAHLPLGMQERGGLSDGNLIWDAVPTLDGLGPWGDNDHCSERSEDGSKVPEYVEVSSFVPKAMLNILAIEKLLSLTAPRRPYR